MANALLLAALEYEAKGFSIIPLKPRDKIPLIPSWTEFQVERADREQLGEWWRTWPNANIGVLTGSISGGTYVIDTDSPEAATAIKPILGDMSEVGISATGKGFHLWYWHGGEALNNKAGIRPQIDFRGDGGYVVAPPSIHSSGKHYEWVKPINGHLRPLPQEFLDLLAAGSQANAARVKFDTAAALNGIPEGGRDQAIFKLAAKLRGADVPYEVALELCEQAAANCNPPFREARRKVDQAYKYSPGHGNNSIAPPIEDPSFWPMPLTMKDFLAQKFDEHIWIWDRIIPFGEVAMLCGEPRAGKTTMALNLALAISRGVPFLKRATMRNRCLYVAIDNSPRDMKIICDQIGCTDNDDVQIHVGKIPAMAIDWCLDLAVKVAAKFIVIDTLERFFERHDINKPDFAKAMYPLDLEIKKLGITPIYIHHATAKPPLGAKVGSLFMGHTTVKGMTPYYLELMRVGESRHRILSSDLRSGDNIEGIYVKLDRATGWAVKGGRLEDALMDDYKDRITEFLNQNDQASRAQIREAVEGRKQLVNMAISKLLEDGLLEKVDPLINTGKPHHPEILTLAKKLI